MESNDLTEDQVIDALRRERALRDLCERYGEPDGAAAHWSTVRALEQELTARGRAIPNDPTYPHPTHV